MVKKSDKFEVMSINGKSPIGYFLEVDLEYSDKLHELHNRNIVKKLLIKLVM